MKKHKRVIVYLFIFGAIILSMVLNYFRLIEDQIILESNRLYTDNSRVIANFNLLQNKEVHQFTFRAFGEFVDSPNVRVFYSNNYSGWIPMLRDGSFFSKKDTIEAIVGENVHVDVQGGSEYYLFDGNKYKVIGHWGITKTNFMDDQVLLNDSSYFGGTNIKTIVDSDDIKAIEQSGAEFRGFPIKDRWNPIDDHYFTNYIINFGKFLSALTFSLGGIVFSQQNIEENEIRYLLGENKFKMRAKELVLLNIMFFSAFVIVMIITFKMIPILINQQVMIQNMIYYFILITSFMAYELFLNLRSQKCGR